MLSCALIYAALAALGTGRERDGNGTIVGQRPGARAGMGLVKVGAVDISFEYPPVQSEDA